METVKGISSLREARKADTERRIIEAATQRFVADGYAATSLASVAGTAGVGERTVYVHFGTKAELLKRAIDVAIVGDLLDVDLAHRDWMIEVMTAPTLEQRVAANARGVSEVMARIAQLIAVATEAAASEAVIAAAAQAGREATLASIRAAWEQLRADELISDDVDVDWVVDTMSLLGHAETYVLMTRTLRWDGDTFERWLYRTWMHFATTPSPEVPDD